MSDAKLSGKQLISIGFPEGKVIGMAVSVIGKHYSNLSAEAALDLLKTVLDAPELFLNDSKFRDVAMALIPKIENEAFQLRKNGIPYAVYGAAQIEAGAVLQMETASRLAVSVAGALMPDAHQGYGLPIGGVLATKDAIIPYAVGVDIGCRMCLSIYDLPPEELLTRKNFFKRELIANTLFGAGRDFSARQDAKGKRDHPVLQRSEFSEISFVRALHSKAAAQLGSSGSGNHFVEFGVVEIRAGNDLNGVRPGKYVALLSHSGSRGLGAMIAGHYTQLAKKETPLPDEAKHLAWLDVKSETGHEYWLAMNLAGDYASACHHIIHEKMAAAISQRVLTRVENHHNFAWKENVNGSEHIVHRKGATPAGKNVLGIIPGSMIAPGFIVKGKGNADSLNSASHGAGRRMSRTKALASITHSELHNQLKDHGVMLIGGGLDEAPDAYKNIHDVMEQQAALVDILGTFQPVIVRMDDAVHKGFRGRKNRTNPADGA